MKNPNETLKELRERREVLRRICDDISSAEARVTTDAQDRFALYALSDFVHRFYGCAEDAGYRTAIEINGHVPTTPDWHEQLLKQAYREVPGLRPALFRRTPFVDLDELRRFRHWFRHNYGAEVNREKMLANARRALRIAPDIEADIIALEGWLASQ